MRSPALLSLLLLAASTVVAQFRLLPGAPLPVRFTARQEEPRTGVRKETGTPRLKLDIGAACDLLEIRPTRDSGAVFRLGAEFFTYALTTSADGFRLQVDAVDGFFGGHVLSLIPDPSGATAFRLRILHISSHTVDGRLTPAGTWRDGRGPVPYTRDFAEVTALREFGTSFGHVGLYVGAGYATLVRPATLNRRTFHAGGEIVDRTLLGSLWGAGTQLYAALHVDLRGIPTWIGTVEVESGIRLGRWDGGGLRLYFSYHAGTSTFAQYYDVRDETAGIGFAFDLW